MVLRKILGRFLRYCQQILARWKRKAKRRQPDAFIKLPDELAAES